MLPEAKSIDARLVIGAAVFGLGWGASGYCPAPALVALGTGSASAWVFAVAMAVGLSLRWPGRVRAPQAARVG